MEFAKNAHKIHSMIGILTLVFVGQATTLLESRLSSFLIKLKILPVHLLLILDMLTLHTDLPEDLDNML